MKPLSTLVAIMTVTLLASVAFPSSAEASITLSQRGCQTYASWSGNIVWARDLGADREKTRLELVGLDQKTPSNIFALMLRNLETLWTTTATWETVTVVLLQDCLNRRGQYEDAT